MIGVIIAASAFLIRLSNDYVSVMKTGIPVSHAELVGNYVGGGLTVCKLALSQDQKFSYTCWLRMENYVLAAGTYEFDGFDLLLKDQLPEKVWNLEGLWHPVRWGERLYIVADNGFVSFCADIEQELEPRTSIRGSAYLKVGDQKKKGTGLPIIPDAFKEACRDVK